MKRGTPRDGDADGADARRTRARVDPLLSRLAQLTTPTPLGIQTGQHHIDVADVREDSATAGSPKRRDVPAEDGWLRDPTTGEVTADQRLRPPFNDRYLAEEQYRFELLNNNADYRFAQLCAGLMARPERDLFNMASARNAERAEREYRAQQAAARERHAKAIEQKMKELEQFRAQYNGILQELTLAKTVLRDVADDVLHSSRHRLRLMLAVVGPPGDEMHGFLFPYYMRWQYRYLKRALAVVPDAADTCTPEDITMFDTVYHVDDEIYRFSTTRDSERLRLKALWLELGTRNLKRGRLVMLNLLAEYVYRRDFDHVRANLTFFNTNKPLYLSQWLQNTLSFWLRQGILALPNIEQHLATLQPLLPPEHTQGDVAPQYAVRLVEANLFQSEQDVNANMTGFNILWDVFFPAAATGEDANRPRGPMRNTGAYIDRAKADDLCKKAQADVISKFRSAVVKLPDETWLSTLPPKDAELPGEREERVNIWITGVGDEDWKQELTNWSKRLDALLLSEKVHSDVTIDSSGNVSPLPTALIAPTLHDYDLACAQLEQFVGPVLISAMWRFIPPPEAVKARNTVPIFSIARSLQPANFTALRDENNVRRLFFTTSYDKRLISPARALQLGDMLDYYHFARHGFDVTKLYDIVTDAAQTGFATADAQNSVINNAQRAISFDAITINQLANELREKFAIYSTTMRGIPIGDTGFVVPANKFRTKAVRAIYPPGEEALISAPNITLMRDYLVPIVLRGAFTRTLADTLWSTDREDPFVLAGIGGRTVTHLPFPLAYGTTAAIPPPTSSASATATATAASAGTNDAMARVIATMLEVDDATSKAFLINAADGAESVTARHWHQLVYSDQADPSASALHLLQVHFTPLTALPLFCDFIAFLYHDRGVLGNRLTRFRAAMSQIEQMLVDEQSHNHELADHSADTLRDTAQRIHMPSSGYAHQPHISGLIYFTPFFKAALVAVEQYARAHSSRPDITLAELTSEKTPALQYAVAKYIAAHEVALGIEHPGQYKKDKEMDMARRILRDAELALLRAIDALPAHHTAPGTTSSSGRGGGGGGLRFSIL